MCIKWSVGAVAALILVTGLLVQAQMAEHPKQSSPPAGATTRPARLVLPWNLLTSLTEEQISQIQRIHREALDAKAKIDQKEEADILALLTDEQKMELNAAKQARAAQDRARRAAAREASAAGESVAASADETNEQPAEGPAPAQP